MGAALLTVGPLFFMVRALESAIKIISERKHLIVEITGLAIQPSMRVTSAFVLMGLVLARRAMMRGMGG